MPTPEQRLGPEFNQSMQTLLVFLKGSLSEEDLKAFRVIAKRSPEELATVKANLELLVKALDTEKAE